MSQLPLKLSGPKEDGSMGVYTAEEIRKWIIGKLGLTEGQAKARGGSISSVVTDFTDGTGKATSGPGMHGGPAHTSLYHGNPVYHAGDETRPGGQEVPAPENIANDDPSS